jgi:cobalt-zinc-cadmium resistance protein CzcA
MTTSVAMLGLTPAALSHGIGSETQRPLAIVVIGGALILAVVPRLLQPALLVLAHRRQERPQGTESPSLAPASAP